MTRARPYRINKGDQKDGDFFVGLDRMCAMMLQLDTSRTNSTALAATYPDGGDTQLFSEYLLGVLAQVEVIAKGMAKGGLKSGVGAVKEVLNFNTHWEAVWGGSRFADEDAIDSDKDGVSSELQITELQRRIAYISAMSTRTGNIFPNRLWDSDGDEYLIDFLSVVECLKWHGTYVGMFVQTAVAGIIHEAQFGHRLSNFGIGGDDPLHEIYEWFTDVAVASGEADHVAHPVIFKEDSLPTSSQIIRSALEHEFELSKLGIGFGRFMSGFTDYESYYYKNRNFWFIGIGMGNDCVDGSDLVDFATVLATALRLLSDYTDCVKALRKVVEKHAHKSWDGAKAYFEDAFAPVSLKSFQGMADADAPIVWELINQAVDSTVSNGWYTNMLTQYDGSTNAIALLLAPLFTADDGSSLFIDNVSERQLKMLFTAMILFSGEETAKMIEVYKTGGQLYREVGDSDYAGWQWDPDSAVESEMWRQTSNPQGAEIVTLVDVQIDVRKITPSVGIVKLEEVTEHLMITDPGTIEVEYFHSDAVQEQFCRECLELFEGSSAGRKSVDQKTDAEIEEESDERDERDS
jgi:hypothetical protein